MSRLQTFFTAAGIGFATTAVLVTALTYKPRLVVPCPAEMVGLGRVLEPKGHRNIEQDCREIVIPLSDIKNNAALGYDALALTKAMFGGRIFATEGALLRWLSNRKDISEKDAIYDVKSLPRAEWRQGRRIAGQIELHSISAMPDNFVKRVELKHILPFLHATHCLEAKRSQDGCSMRYRFGCTALDPNNDVRMSRAIVMIHRIYARALLQDAVRQMPVNG